MSFAKAPNFSSAIHKAALHINRVGPLTTAALFEAVDFGVRTDHQKKLNYAFEIKWLCLTPDGLVDLTEGSRRHFAPKPKKVPYIGKKAPPAHRPNVFASTLDKRYHLKSRGSRADVPAWSVRPAGFGVKGVGGDEP